MVCLCEGLVFVWCCLFDGAFRVRGLVWGAMFWGLELDFHFGLEITFSLYLFYIRTNHSKVQRLLTFEPLNAKSEVRGWTPLNDL